MRHPSIVCEMIAEWEAENCQLGDSFCFFLLRYRGLLNGREILQQLQVRDEKNRALLFCKTSACSMGMMLVDMRSRSNGRPEPSYQYIGQAKGDAATDN